MTKNSGLKNQIRGVVRLEGAWLYVVPFVLYVLAGDVAGIIPGIPRDYQIYIGYTFRTALVGGVLLKSWTRYPELSKRYRTIDPSSLALGAAIFIIWVGLEGRYPTPFSPGAHYDPTPFSSPFRWLLILIRLIGSVLVAPLIEELFMRSFFIRYAVNPEWESVPTGKYTFESFMIVTLIFGLSHFRWLPALITSALLNLLLYKKKSVFPCIAAHATANLLLLGYVVATNSWSFY